MTESFRIGLSEVVLRTPHYERLCRFYTEILRQPPTLDMTPASGVGTADPDTPTRIAFFQLPGGFPYTQRIAVFECADVGGVGRRSVGLHTCRSGTPTWNACTVSTCTSRRWVCCRSKRPTTVWPAASTTAIPTATRWSCRG